MPPAASSHESQGLKIAVTVFVVLTVILGVTTYLGYNNYSKGIAETESAKKKASDSDAQVRTITANYRELREKVGGQEYVKYEEAPAIAAALAKLRTKLQDGVRGVIEDSNKAVAEAQNKGLSRKEVSDLKDMAAQIDRRFRSEETQTLESMSTTLVDLLRNQASLTTAFALDNMDHRGVIESVNQANEQKVKIAEETARKAIEEKKDADRKHEQDRQDLLTKIDNVNTKNAELLQQVGDLKGKIDRMDVDFRKQLVTYQNINRQNQNRLRQDEKRLEAKDGDVTYMDLSRREVWTNINRGMGAYPQLRFSIFDKAAPGLPTDKPKATIELTWVGEKSSRAKIVHQVAFADPIKAGDQVYSPTWDPNRPLRFALIGKIDVNRDGTDDRDTMRRMIEAAGGIVEYDLPPPRDGVERGKISPQIDWYVIETNASPYGTRQARNQDIGRATAENENKNDATAAAADDLDKTYLDRKTAVLRECVDDGIRPMPVSRLVSYLGYHPGQVLPGQPESIDRNMSATLQQGKKITVPGPKTSDDATDAETVVPKPAAGTKPAAEDMKKEDEDK